MKRIFTLILCLVFTLSLASLSYAKDGPGKSNSGSNKGPGKAGASSTKETGQKGGKVEAAATENTGTESGEQKAVKTPPARQKGVHPSVKVRGNELKFDVPPVIKEGRTLIPVRAIMNSLGAEVAWDGETKTVTITKGEQTIVLALDSRTVTVNGTEQQIDYPAQLISNRTFVPIRFIAETFGAKVNYDEETDTVIVDDGTDTAQPDTGDGTGTNDSVGETGSNTETGTTTPGTGDAEQTDQDQTGGTQTDTTETDTTQTDGTQTDSTQGNTTQTDTTQPQTNPDDTTENSTP